MPSSGSFRLFRVFGITVYLHSLWFLVAFYEIGTRKRSYSSISWNIAEYLALFAIVLLHEFGHALACRQVGGTADKILLWPMGGVAYVNPPTRPGATLWSIVAGPLVNVAIGAVLITLPRLDPSLVAGRSDIHTFLWSVSFTNWALLFFNILPIYPLDGGQILRSLLWFVFGRARSLTIATWLGAVGVVALFLLALRTQNAWLGVVAVYMLFKCWRGIQMARTLAKYDNLPRREDFACPSCSRSPRIGLFWRCQCGTRFDTFATQASCPKCAMQFPTTQCVDCQAKSPFTQWKRWSVASTSA